MMTVQKERFVREYADDIWCECLKMSDDMDVCEKAFEDIFSIAVRVGVDRCPDQRSGLMKLTKIYMEKAAG